MRNLKKGCKSLAKSRRPEPSKTATGLRAGVIPPLLEGHDAKRRVSVDQDAEDFLGPLLVLLLLRILARTFAARLLDPEIRFATPFGRLGVDPGGLGPGNLPTSIRLCFSA